MDKETVEEGFGMLGGQKYLLVVCCPQCRNPYISYFNGKPDLLQWYIANKDKVSTKGAEPIFCYGGPSGLCMPVIMMKYDGEEECDQ
jgi:hypothetical protein